MDIRVQSRSKQNRKRPIESPRKYHGRLPAGVNMVQQFRGDRKDRTELAAHVKKGKKHGYSAAGNVLADIPPPDEIARNLGVAAEPDRQAGVNTADEASEVTNESPVALYVIAAEMEKAGLPNSFIVAAVETAHKFKSVFNLLKMWRTDSDETATISVIQELIEEWADARAKNPFVPSVDPLSNCSILGTADSDEPKVTGGGLRAPHRSPMSGVPIPSRVRSKTRKQHARDENVEANGAHNGDGDQDTLAARRKRLAALRKHFAASFAAAEDEALKGDPTRRLGRTFNRLEKRSSGKKPGQGRPSRRRPAK
jgi:hypothetical protein